MMNFQQHQCKGRPHTQKKAQGAATSMADALLRNVERSQFIWRALYLTTVDPTYRKKTLPNLDFNEIYFLQRVWICLHDMTLARN